jgi:L-lactate dehydrogenase
VIVGTGQVGATTAYALLLSGIVSELVLIDRDRRHAEGHVQDLRDAALFARTTRVVVGDFSDCRDADVVVITAGVHQDATMRSRLDDLKESAAILRELVSRIRQAQPAGVLLIASNPVDVLTGLAWRWSGLAPARVIGSGTALDTARLRWRLGQLYDVAPENVHAYVVGEHGDSQTAALSSARIAGIPIEQFCRDRELTYDATVLAAIADETRRAGLEILRAKGATCYGIGSALARLVAAIVRDERAMFTVSTRVPPSMELGEVWMSLPAILSRDGVVRVLPPSLNDDERQRLRNSAEILRRAASDATLQQGGL